VIFRSLFVCNTLNLKQCFEISTNQIVFPQTNKVRYASMHFNYTQDEFYRKELENILQTLDFIQD